MFSLAVSEDIILRNYQEEDAPVLFTVIDVNRQHLRPWLIWVDGTLKEEHSLEYIRAARQEQYDQKSMALGIFKNERLIGGMGMHQWDQQLKKAQIGYWLIKEAEGKGILNQCATTMLHYLFGQLQLNKIELHHLPGNVRSAAVARRLHFKVEGILRDSFLMNGKLNDLVINGLLRKEWQVI
jgi:ribosomal-protein-serine acetyltransferase